MKGLNECPPLFCMQLFKKLLWEANLSNILAGFDEFSPLLMALPRVYAQDETELVQIIKERYLIQPPKPTKQYNIQATQDTSMGQAQTIRRILNDKVVSIFSIHLLYPKYTLFFLGVPLRNQ